jgi:hypothetical protein
MENAYCKEVYAKFYVLKEMPWKLLHVAVMIVVITFLSLYVHVNCYFQVHQAHARSDLSLAIFWYVIIL